MLKKFFAGVLVLCLAQAGIQASAVEFSPAGKYDNSKALIIEQWDAPREQQSLGFWGISSGTKAGFNYFCEDLLADGCLGATGPNQWVRVQVVLPPCDRETDTNCIDSLSVYKQGSKPVPAKYIRSVAGNTWDASPSRNIPQGGTTSLWSQEELPNGSGVGLYSVMVKMELGNNPGEEFAVSSFEAQVVPYQLAQNPEYKAHECYQRIYVENGNTDSVACGGIRSTCAWSETGYCGEIVGYAPETRIKLSLRLSNSIGGWFSGRIKDPLIDVKVLNNKQNSVVVDASPVEIPMLKAGTDTIQASAELKALFSTCPEYRANGRCWTTMDSRSKRSAQFVDAYRDVVKDSASYVKNLWLIRAETDRSGNKCLDSRNRVLGIVATNAMVYQSGIPEFSSGALKYWVAGMHYLPDGKSLALGSYDLVMRSDVARCLYGFSNAPIQASVTITGEGDTNVATTITSEANGWLKLAAYGFTFSEKTVRVQMSQKPAAGKITITCVKGKTVKKVTAINPKCPAGYKKK